MINTLIALIMELFPEELTQDQGEALAKKIVQGTLPADFTSSRRQVKQWLKEVRAEN